MTTPKRHQEFIDQVREAGWPKQDLQLDYHGRFFYVGPALVLPKEDLQEIIRATTMELEWDDMGRDSYIVYPR